MSSLAEALRERALAHLMRHNTTVPTKRDLRRSGGSLKDPRVRADRKELSRHPGDSRSRTLDAIKAIASQYTGCRLATQDELRRLGRFRRSSHRTGMVLLNGSRK